MMVGRNKHLGLAIALMIVFAISRLPGLMPENFSAAYAITFCAGVFFPGAMAWWLPLGALFTTDIFLNIFYYNAPVISPFMVVIYVSYALIVLIGKKIGRSASFLFLLTGGLLGAVLFYVITNTLSWITDPAYSKSLIGWIQSITVGHPEFPPTWVFFKNTIISTGLFTGLFVGSMKIAESVSEDKAKENEEEPEGETSTEKAES